MVCISGGPRVDGGLTLVLSAPESRWVKQARASARARLKAGDPLDIITRDGEILSFRVKSVTGSDKGGRLVLLFLHDGTQLTFATAPRESGGDPVFLRAPKHALWGEGLDSWLRRWLDRASQLALGTPCESPTDARALGWEVECLDICADFAGPADLFVPERDGKWWRCGTVLHSLIIESRKKGHGYASMHRRYHGDSHDSAVLSLSVQHKAPVIIGEVDKCEPTASIYAPTWTAHGWDGASDVWRIEFRLRDGALHRKHGPNLKNPANLTAANLRLAFSDAMTRYRMLAPDGDTDPRWTQLRHAAGAAEAVDLGAGIPTARPLNREQKLRQALGLVASGMAKVRELAPDAPLENIIDLIPPAMVNRARARTKIAMLQ